MQSTHRRVHKGAGNRGISNRGAFRVQERPAEGCWEVL